jgi:hypothetical protein
MKFNPLTESEVVFSVYIVPCQDNPWDAFEDEEIAKQVSADLEFNPWAWCDIRVVARWKDYTGDDYLGECSYGSEEEFKQDGYYSDMKKVALDNLNSNIAKLVNNLSERII